MRLGVFQCAGGGLPPAQRLERLAAAISDQNLDLVVCPELFLSGYNAGDNLHRLAETFDGDFNRKVAALAKATRTAITYGFPERADGQVYNSALCVDTNAEVVALHRKTLLPPGMEQTCFSAGDTQPPVFEVAGMRCGLLICYEVEFPEAVRALAEAGADLILVPTALVDVWGVVAHQLIPARAFENGVYMAYANHAGTENGANFLGASCITGPQGQDVARAGSEEMLIIAEIDADAARAAQARLPYLQDVKRLRAVLDAG